MYFFKLSVEFLLSITIHLIFQAGEYNKVGNYSDARECGNMALGCNIFVIILFTVTLIVAVVVGVLFGVVFYQ